MPNRSPRSALCHLEAYVVEKLRENTKVILNENKGFGHAANLGARYADTKYLLFCSPDNIVENNGVESEFSFQSSVMINNNANGGSGGGLYMNNQGYLTLSYIEKSIFDEFKKKYNYLNINKLDTQGIYYKILIN